MLYATHREFSLVFVYLGAMLLYNTGVTNINYYLALAIMVPMSQLGAKFPDVDHDWDNVKDKTTVNFIINFIITKVLRGKHRSWVTHSLDITIYGCMVAYFVPKYLYEVGKIDIVNYEVASIIAVGFCFGWVSHIFADMLNHTGVRLFFFAPWTIAFVPKKFLFIEFKTGKEWEKAVYKFTKICNIPLSVIALGYPILFRDYFMSMGVTFGI